MSLPTLHTDRLLLRPFTAEDAPRLQELAGAEEVASNTLRIPHPYEDGMAEAWIAGHGAAWEERDSLTLAVTTEADGLVGTIGLDLAPQHRRAELGYWIGVPYWGRGYATEAVVVVLDHGFTQLGLERIHACHYLRNPASGRVLEKAGMRHEGTLRSHVVRFGRREDLECRGILREEWGGGASGED